MDHDFKYGDKVKIADPFFQEGYITGKVDDYNILTNLEHPNKNRSMIRYTIILDNGHIRDVLETELVKTI